MAEAGVILSTLVRTTSHYSVTCGPASETSLLQHCHTVVPGMPAGEWILEMWGLAPAGEKSASAAGFVYHN